MFRPDMLTVQTPNLSPRRKAVTLIVLHHTGSAIQSAVSWLTSPGSKVSADFVISRTGKIYRLNTDVHWFYTWHAGVSIWKGLRDVNKFSIGIEHEHIPGQDWPDTQIEASAKLCAWLTEEFSLPLNNNPITSHRAIAWPRKTDPENFPWAKFGARVREIREACGV